MKHFKSLTLLLILLLGVACTTDDDQFLETTNITEKPLDVTSKNSGSTINTDNRIIIGQLFSGPNYTGQVYTVSIPKNWNGNPLRPKIGFIVRSAAFVDGIEFRKRIGGRLVVAHNYVQYLPNVNWSIRQLRNSIVFVDNPGNFKRYDGIYTGQLHSTNNSSQIPIWGNVDLANPALRSVFNDKVKAFIPASKTNRGMIALRADASITSHMISLIGIKEGHVHDNRIITQHPAVQRKASYLQVTNRSSHLDLFNFLSWHPHKTYLDQLLEINPQQGRERAHCSYNSIFLGFQGTSPGAAFVQARRCGVKPIVNHFAGKAKLYTDISGFEQEERPHLKKEILDEMRNFELQKIKDKLEKITGKKYRWDQINIRYYGNGTFVIWVDGDDNDDPRKTPNSSRKDHDIDEAFERQLSNYYIKRGWKTNLLIPTNGGVAPDFLAACKLMEVKNTSSTNPKSLVSNVIIKKAFKQIVTKFKKDVVLNEGEIIIGIDDNAITPENLEPFRSRIQDALNASPLPTGFRLRIVFHRRNNSTNPTNHPVWLFNWDYTKQ